MGRTPRRKPKQTPYAYEKKLEDLYNKLEYVITAHVSMIGGMNGREIMKNSIGKIAYYFNSHRMMRRYVTDAYL